MVPGAGSRQSVVLLACAAPHVSAMCPRRWIAVAALALLAAACKSAATSAPELSSDVPIAASYTSKRSVKSIGSVRLPAGCLFGGGWYREGASVPAGEACLQCACVRGALSCRRQACAPLPAAPPHRCHVLHRRGACCPELHCPDGVTLTEQEASARFENDDVIASPTSIGHSCVEGGSIYAAGSAMATATACEQCFCLGGARRCVRPRCLPPPAHCEPRRAPGACCPLRYYCREHATEPPLHKHLRDCKIDVKWITEGERVPSPRPESDCTQCFCLKGEVRCHSLSCAPPLMGCEPLLRPGECCAHQYRCERGRHGTHSLTFSSNAVTSIRNDDRAFHSREPNERETTTKNTPAELFTEKNIPPLIATKNHLVGTTKVKRKTSDPPPEISSQIPHKNITTTAAPATTVSTTTREPTTSTKSVTTTETTASVATEVTTELASTEQPEASVRIMINGTINCTAELSSTSLPLNVSLNDTEKIQLESQPRIPLIVVSNLEDHTFSPNDIITDRAVNDGFDENESFVINVTSSLRTNTSHTATKPPVPTVTKVSVTTGKVEALNSSKKTKGDYDYDYTEPTLPPSLPNLKIIPFVAADAVVEDEHTKDTLKYPILEREDKFPVYYPTADTKDAVYATRREDTYRPTQYPVFITDKPGRDRYPSLTQDVDITNTGYSNLHSALDSSGNEFTASGSLGDRAPDNINGVATQSPVTTTTFKLETPAVNLFSPPAETEGGFVPKGPTGLIDEYFAVFPSTPSGPAAPQLTTSMQLDVAKGECVSSDGRRVEEGESITVSCSECRCSWGSLRCAPRLCTTPPACTRSHSQLDPADHCCGEILCDQRFNETTSAPKLSTETVAKTTEKMDFKNIAESTEPGYVPAINSTNATLLVDSPAREPNFTASPASSIKAINNVPAKIATTSKAPQRLTTKAMMTTTAAPPALEETNQSSNQSLEYEEDEDEGFSFGSVLKLLLSDTYETTTAAPKRAQTTSKPTPPVKIKTTRRPRPPLDAMPPKPTVAPFIPLPLNPYMPPRKNQNSINRIDHLVLGEATAIKTTSRPTASTPRYTTTSRPTTQRISTRTTDATKAETYTTQEAPRPPGPSPGIGPGLLKLAGCNIYGRMYRVGRIIAELSTPCQECWCTELGVQCKQLKC